MEFLGAPAGNLMSRSGTKSLPYREHRPSGSQPVQHRRIDLVQDPPRVRRRRDRAEQDRLIPQHREVADRAPAIREQDREIGQHPARVMGRAVLPQPGERVAERVGQPGLVGAIPASSRDPTCDTTPAPSVVTVIVGRAVVGCTSEVPPPCAGSEPRELRSNRPEQALSRIQGPCRATNITPLLQQPG